MAAVLAGLLPFLLLELALRGFDGGQPADSPDPLSGFNRHAPLFECNAGVYRTTRTRERFFARQEFPVAKPAGEFRIFCFGGSTVFGHPYQAATAFPQWLEMELNAGDPTRKHRVINCGGISYASYREAALVKEVLQYQPDLIILATGHNEFLEDRTYRGIKRRTPVWAWLQDAGCSLRTVALARRWLADASASVERNGFADEDFSLSQEVQARLDRASGYASYHRDDAWRESVIAQFDEAIRDMVARCRAAGVPLLLVKPGANLRDCPPFKSEHRAGLAPDEERVWQDAFDAATLVEKTNVAEALELYRKAEAIDGEYALVNYRIARALDRLGRIPEALTYYSRARDEDICPLRMLHAMERLLDRIAVETGTPLLDAARLLSGESFDFIPGFDSYLDHVHPTIGGHQKIARALAVKMREAGLTSNGVSWPEAARRETYARHLAQLGERYFAEGRQRVNWLENWARRERLFDETLPQDAQGHVRLGFRRFDLGDAPAAWVAFDEAIQRDAATIELLRQRARNLAAQGRPEYADDLLRYAASQTATPRGQAGVAR